MFQNPRTGPSNVSPWLGRQVVNVWWLVINLEELAMKKLLTSLCAAVLLSNAAAQEQGVVSLQSKYSVAETIDRVEAAVRAANGFQVFARVDFQAVAAAQGGKVRPTQILIFGRGTVLQALLPQYPVTALDFPLKILSWEDESGRVMLAYNTGEYLAQRHGIKDKDDVLKRITDATSSFTKPALE